MRLNRFLAAAGIGSRRHCDELIAAGRVTINGKICTDFSAQPDARDHVKVNGKLVHVAPPLTIMLHKPAGFVSTRKDPHVRDTVFDLLPAKFSGLFNIGRLDAQTEGLLLLTNDGDLAQSLTHPRYKIEKEYEVTLDRPWDPAPCVEIAARNFSRWSASKDCATPLRVARPTARCPATGNQSPDSPYVRSRWLSRQRSHPRSHR